jgi:hypothetical protein
MWPTTIPSKSTAGLPTEQGAEKIQRTGTNRYIDKEDRNK